MSSDNVRKHNINTNPITNILLIENFKQVEQNLKHEVFHVFLTQHCQL